MALSVRSGRLFVLVDWAAFLLWLLYAHQVPRYLGPRTAWIVPVGLVILALTSAGYGVWTRDSEIRRRRLTRREAMWLAPLLAPVVVGLCLADATLGSLAAGNKLSARGVSFSHLAGSLASDGTQVDFLRIEVADSDPVAARRARIVPGAPVKLEGFVLEPAKTADDPVRLARFYITCCVADAVALDVRVYLVSGAQALRKDQWLETSGVLARRSGHLVVVGAQARRVSPPAKPYLQYRL